MAKRDFFIPMDLDEFRDLITSIVRSELQNILPDGPAQNENALIGTADACKMLGVSKVTLLDWRKKGLVPLLSFGRADAAWTMEAMNRLGSQ